MKRNRIKFLLLLLLLPFGLFASTYEWKAFIDKESAYTNEGVYLKYVCEFSDRAELLSVDFNPVTENEEYTIKLLSETTKIQNYKKIITYEFVAFIHKPGTIAFEFDMSMKETNQDSIENTVIGRDNGKYAEYTELFLKQKKLLVSVEDAKSHIVGNLDFTFKKEEPEVKALTPYHLEISLEGVANFDEIKSLDFKIDGVKVFSNEPVENTTLTKSGYQGTWSQKFAFVGEKDFQVPAFKMHYFNIKSQKIEEFNFNAIDVLVTKGYVKEDLLDEEDVAFAFNYEYLYYLLTFIAGFLASKIKFRRREKETSKNESFREKIEKAKTMDEILFILALENSLEYRELISKIEKGDLSSLKEVKKLI